jgi:hypothetical protein
MGWKKTPCSGLAAPRNGMNQCTIPGSVLAGNIPLKDDFGYGRAKAKGIFQI